MKKPITSFILLSVIFVLLFAPMGIVYAIPYFPIEITISCPLVEGQVGKPYSNQLTATDGVEPLHWYIPDGTLPPGLSINTTTGVISGTPTQDGTYKFSITVYDAHQSFDGPIQCSIKITKAVTPTPTTTLTPTKMPTPTTTLAPTTTPILFDYNIDAVEPVLVLDPNAPKDPETGQIEVPQQIVVKLLSGDPLSGAFFFEDLPEGIGYSCDEMEGSPPFISQCRFYFEDLETIPQEGDYEIPVGMVIANLIRNDIFIIRIPRIHDIEVLEIKPVQVVYDAVLHGYTTLVKDKVTAFKVIVNSTYADVVEIEFALKLPDEDWDTFPPSTGRVITGVPPDWEYPDIWGPVSISPGTSEIILPYIEPGEEDAGFSLSKPAGLIRGSCVGNICGPDVRVMPRPNHIGMVNFSVVADPENTLGEIYFSNNTLAGVAHAISTRPWDFYVVPYQDVGSGCSPERENLENGVKHMLEYLLALYPIADSEITYSFAQVTTAPCLSDPTQTCVYSDTWEARSDDYSGFQSRGEFLGEISDLALSEGYDFAIGVGCGCGGGAGGSATAFFSGDCSGTFSDVMAHEFNHVVTGMGDIYSLDCLAEWNEAYCEHADGTRDYYCYEDARYKRDGYVGINCSIETDGTLNCLPGIEKQCAGSCNCSIYEANYEVYPICPGVGVCDAGCCRGIATADCSDGTVYSGPDGRIFHPASEGFWVNRYLPVSSNAVYIMDTYWPSVAEEIRHWMRLENTYQHCYEDRVFNDGYLNLLRNPRFLDSEDPEALLISGELGSDGTVSLNPFLQITAPRVDLIPGEGTGYSLVLLDDNDTVLETNYFEPQFFQSDPNGGLIDSVHISYRIQWVEGTKTIELRDPGDGVLISRIVSDNAPKIEISTPKAGSNAKIGDLLTVKWNASDPDNDVLTYSLSISTDEGDTWQPILIFYDQTSYKLATASFSENTELLIKIRATDGVNTSEAVLSSPIILGTTGFSIFSVISPYILLGAMMLLGLGFVVVIVFLVRRSRKA